MHIIEAISYLAALLTLFAFVHLYWPQNVKQVVDRLSQEIGTDLFQSEYDEQYYYFVGGIYGICAILTCVAAVVWMLVQG